MCQSSVRSPRIVFVAVVVSQKSENFPKIGKSSKLEDCHEFRFSIVRIVINVSRSICPRIVFVAVENLPKI